MNVLQNVPEEVITRAKGVRLLAMDVDGVLSDGRLYFSANGDELKAFNILDGLGIKLLQRAGILTALITGRHSPLTARRAGDLGIIHLYQGRDDKLQALQELASDLHLTLAECAYIGDDLPDLGAIRAAGLGVTVPNGYWQVRQAAHWCTSTGGGQGAVRELSDLILAAQGQLQPILRSFEQEPD
ncbi:MAG: HAD family hydrolase [Halomonadaceae bacterium]|nr:MAG: HAD family hydrolase [Halomonadaceae bacterium]